MWFHPLQVLNCPAVSQTLMFKGSLADDDVLRNKKFKKNCKVLLVGATAVREFRIWFCSLRICEWT
jgi:hypothetical protein